MASGMVSFSQFMPFALSFKSAAGALPESRTPVSRLLLSQSLSRSIYFVNGCAQGQSILEPLYSFRVILNSARRLNIPKKIELPLGHELGSEIILSLSEEVCSHHLRRGWIEK